MTFISRVANISAYCFLVITLLLTGVCIVGIWGGFNEVIGKTFASMGLISFAFFVVLAIDGNGHFRKTIQASAVNEYMRAVEYFVLLRKVSFYVVIVSVTVSVFLGLLSIWEILEGTILYKTLGTIASVGFYALITILVCKQRENSIKSIAVEPLNVAPLPVSQISVPPQVGI